MNDLQKLAKAIGEARGDIGLTRVSGTVTSIAAGHLTVSGLSRSVSIGDRIVLSDSGGHFGEVIRIDARSLTAKLFEEGASVTIGARAYLAQRNRLSPSRAWRGRIIDALGRPIDGGGPLQDGDIESKAEGTPPPALLRARVDRAVETGVRAIDIFTPLCFGQRVGVFAGSGVGKSTLLGMLARARGFDSVVIALVGERGREVREFIEEILGPAAATAVVVVATSDESPMLRRLAPKTAMTIAESLRDVGDSVLLIVDSITRFAHALRDVSLAAGEPPVARGYTPSVFSDLPRRLERAGPGAEGKGSITGVFSVLVDGDDHNDPVADSVRGTLDGHIVLDRAIANRGRFPAIDVLASVSRLAHHAWTPDQQKLVTKLKSIVALYEDTRDLRAMGGHQQGRDPELDHAIDLTPRVYAALTQSPNGPASVDAFRELAELLSHATQEAQASRQPSAI